MMKTKYYWAYWDDSEGFTIDYNICDFRGFETEDEAIEALEGYGRMHHCKGDDWEFVLVKMYSFVE